MTLYKRKSGIYYAKALINGQIITRSTETRDRKKAQEWHDQTFAAYIQSLRSAPENSRTLAQAIVRELDYIATAISPSQATAVKYHLQAAAGWFGKHTMLADITSSDVEKYLLHRLTRTVTRPDPDDPEKTITRTCRRSRSTITKDRAYLHRLLRRNGFGIEIPPLPRTARSTKVRSFSDDELRRFLACCHSEHQTLFLTLAATGARVAELVPSHRSSHIPLLKSEIDSSEGIITIRSAKARPESDAPVRHIRVAPQLCQRILGQAPPGDYAFSPAPQSISQIFNRTLKRAGIAKIDILGQKLASSSFRHYYATRAHSVFGSDLAVSRILGHTNPATTARYNEFKPDAQVIDITEPLVTPLVTP